MRLVSELFPHSFPRQIRLLIHDILYHISGWIVNCYDRAAVKIYAAFHRAATRNRAAVFKTEVPCLPKIRKPAAVSYAQYNIYTES